MRLCLFFQNYFHYLINVTLNQNSRIGLDKAKNKITYC